MLSIFVTFEVEVKFTVLAKLEAFENISSMLVTLSVARITGWLKLAALVNILLARMRLEDEKLMLIETVRIEKHLLRALDCAHVEVHRLNTQASRNIAAVELSFCVPNTTG